MLRRGLYFILLVPFQVIQRLGKRPKVIRTDPQSAINELEANKEDQQNDHGCIRNGHFRNSDFFIPPRRTTKSEYDSATGNCGNGGKRLRPRKQAEWFIEVRASIKL